MSSTLTSFALAHLLNYYTTNLPQIEEHFDFSFDQKPTISLEVPTIGAREYHASYNFTTIHIKIHPEAKESRWQYLIAHELAHHHFNELGYGDEWLANDDWTRFVSEAYAEWVGCSYTNDCEFYRTGGVQKFTFKPGNIPRSSFFPQMQELFEKGGLELMMEHHSNEIPPETEWYEKIEEFLSRSANLP